MALAPRKPSHGRTNLTESRAFQLSALAILRSSDAQVIEQLLMRYGLNEQPGRDGPLSGTVFNENAAAARL